MLQNVNIQQLLSLSPIKLAEWLDKEYVKELPCPKSSSEFAKNNHLLGDLANSYAFLSGIHAVAKIAVRDAKKKKLSADEVNDCIDRRDTIDEFLGIIKMQYNAFSRMITVQKNADDEMKMMQD